MLAVFSGPYLFFIFSRNINDAIWENPSDVALGRFQENQEVCPMSIVFVKIGFSLNYYSLTSFLSSLEITW